MARPVIAGNHWATSAAPRSPAPAPEVPAGTLALAPTCSLLQNWRGDVSLVVTDAARVIEWVQYSAYGVPFGIPGGNASSNGANNVEDLSTLINWINNAVWDARWDLSADGSVTMADYAYWPQKTLGRGKLSWVNNRFGYAGYQHAPELAGTKWHVRHRVLLAELAIFNRRDPHPGRYIDGMNLYAYVRGQPIGWLDPDGRQAVAAEESGQQSCTQYICYRLRDAVPQCNLRIQIVSHEGCLGTKCVREQLEDMRGKCLFFEWECAKKQGATFYPCPYPCSCQDVEWTEYPCTIDQGDYEVPVPACGRRCVVTIRLSEGAPGEGGFMRFRLGKGECKYTDRPGHVPSSPQPIPGIWQH
jgi:RHS repeat-associated protein